MTGGTGPATVRDVVHDLRAPLAALRSQCSRLEAQLDGAQAAELRRIRSVADTMSERVDALLEPGRTPDAAPEPVDIAQLTVEIADRLRPLARIRDISISLSGAPGAMVLGDPAGLDRAIQNLVDNAVRHSPTGATVQCSVRSRLGRVLVLVDDAGSGVPADDRERVLRAGETCAGGGTGLGLAIVDRVARAHRGGVRLDTSPAGGARAVLDLPGTRVRTRRSGARTVGSRAPHQTPVRH